MNRSPVTRALPLTLALSMAPHGALAAANRSSTPPVALKPMAAAVAGAFAKPAVAPAAAVPAAAADAKAAPAAAAVEGAAAAAAQPSQASGTLGRVYDGSGKPAANDDAVPASESAPAPLPKAEPAAPKPAPPSPPKPPAPSAEQVAAQAAMNKALDMTSLAIVVNAAAAGLAVFTPAVPSWLFAVGVAVAGLAATGYLGAKLDALPGAGPDGRRALRKARAASLMLAAATLASAAFMVPFSPWLAGGAAAAGVVAAWRADRALRAAGDALKRSRALYDETPYR